VARTSRSSTVGTTAVSTNVQRRTSSSTNEPLLGPVSAGGKREKTQPVSPAEAPGGGGGMSDSAAPGLKFQSTTRFGYSTLRAPDPPVDPRSPVAAKSHLAAAAAAAALAPARRAPSAAAGRTAGTPPGRSSQQNRPFEKKLLGANFGQSFQCPSTGMRRYLDRARLPLHNTPRVPYNRLKMLPHLGPELPSPLESFVSKGRFCCELLPGTVDTARTSLVNSHMHSRTGYRGEIQPWTRAQ
jgi:hypothetical protein